MDGIETTPALVIGVAGLATVGAYQSVMTITGWLKRLLNAEDRAAMFLTSGVSAFAVTTAMLTQVYPMLAYVFLGVYFTCTVSTMADASFHQQQKGST